MLASRASLTLEEQCCSSFCYQHPLLFEDIEQKLNVFDKVRTGVLQMHGTTEWFTPEVQRLNQQLEEKNGEIQQMINQPPYEKEREILRLQKSLAEREKAQATSDVLCRSLTDETHQLQRKLASTAEMCQHLAKCLEEKQRKEKGNSGDQTPTERSNQLLDNQTSLQALICNLQDENRMLKQKVAHVEDLNAKWQKYDASRDEYVKRLHLQLKEMKSQLEQQHGVTSAQTNSDLMHKEIFRLNKLLEEKMNECIKIKRELEDVKKASEGDHERIQMLEQQTCELVPLSEQRLESKSWKRKALQRWEAGYIAIEDHTGPTDTNRRSYRSSTDYSYHLKLCNK
ncbi:tnfaip3-interacting protein hypothetical protein [Limosa lapponica baueri]|uniref:TSG101 and ALIX binding domain-containing protein n=1 Tax=Limosa lapponica baueri TaxID=1758121 RepID=A0A2I0U775_LIMLA|nr:tnfaip3-interacting protein hypothetical protein [Limosa lapponica baueri]